MEKVASGRVDPRALLRSVRIENGKYAAARIGAGAGKTVAVAMAAVVGLGAFGTIVVRANDDAGALAFIRSQVKPRSAPVEYAPMRQAYPVSYYAPRAFIQPAPPTVRRGQRVQAAHQSGAGQPQRNGAIVASYAPFAGFFPSEAAPGAVREPLRPRSASAPARRAGSGPAREPRVSGGVGRGGSVTYCVRTCDGFYFPLSASTGSARGDEAACNSLCPTSETRVYTGQIGADIEDARARESGRRYAAMSSALSYRKGVSDTCTCSTSGFGLTTAASVAYDRTLRAGDIVMTQKGMRVFIGGQAPYKEANFTSIDRSRTFAGQSRETLRSMERASLPGRSGVAAAPSRQNELSDLRRAAASLPSTSTLVRYVGPDRTSQVR
jgi:Protein of unknown function (DUF2865)